MKTRPGCWARNFSSSNSLNVRSSARPRSRAEVRRYLQRKETPPYIIDAALERLDRLDFVNDRAFV